MLRIHSTWRPHRRFPPHAHTTHTPSLLSLSLIILLAFTSPENRLSRRSNTHCSCSSVHGRSPPAIVALCRNQLLKLSPQTIDSLIFHHVRSTCGFIFRHFPPPPRRSFFFLSIIVWWSFEAVNVSGFDCFWFLLFFCDFTFACENGMHGHGFSGKFVAECVNEGIQIGLPDFLFWYSDSILQGLKRAEVCVLCDYFVLRRWMKC